MYLRFSVAIALVPSCCRLRAQKARPAHAATAGAIGRAQIGAHRRPVWPVGTAAPTTAAAPPMARSTTWTKLTAATALSPSTPGSGLPTSTIARLWKFASPTAALCRGPHHRSSHAAARAIDMIVPASPAFASSDPHPRIRPARRLRVQVGAFPRPRQRRAPAREMQSATARRA